MAHVPDRLPLRVGLRHATEVALLGISATQATQGLSFWAILIFPALFTAGMTLLDTTDSVLMTGAYGWALANPVRKLWYNLTITAASATVALFIGGLEALGLIGDKLGLTGGLWQAVSTLKRQFGRGRLRRRRQSSSWRGSHRSSSTAPRGTTGSNPLGEGAVARRRPSRLSGHALRVEQPCTGLANISKRCSEAIDRASPRRLAGRDGAPWGSKGNAVRVMNPMPWLPPATVSGEPSATMSLGSLAREDVRGQRPASQETCRQSWSHAKRAGRGVLAGVEGPPILRGGGDPRPRSR